MSEQYHRDVRLDAVAIQQCATRSRRLLLERTDIDNPAAVAVAIAGPSHAALVGRGGMGVVALVDGPAAGKEGTRVGGPAVFRQRAQPRIEWGHPRAHLVAVGTVNEPGGAAAIADEVVPAAGKGTGQVGADSAGISKVLGDDGVADGRTTGVRTCDATTHMSFVARDGDVEQTRVLT